MNWVDYIILAIIGISVGISLVRGFTKEALSLAGWVIAVWVGLSFADSFQILLEPHIAVPSLRLVVAFAILFLTALFLTALVNYLAAGVIQQTGLSGTDRMVGIFFGIARGVLITAVLVLIGGMTPMPQDPWWKESQLLHYFQDMATWMRQFLPEGLAENIRY